MIQNKILIVQDRFKVDWNHSKSISIRSKLMEMIQNQILTVQDRFKVDWNDSKSISIRLKQI